MLLLALKPRRYVAIVRFVNEGVTYGTERFGVLADNRREARARAFLRAQASAYNDERLPDREIRIELKEEY